MDIVDLSEANLDGDFLALKVEREKRESEQFEDAQVFKYLKRYSIVDPAVFKDVSKNTKAEANESHRLRDDIFVAVDEDDRNKMDALAKNIKLRGQSIVDDDYKNEAGLTALNYAVQNRRLLVARHLISFCDLEVLMCDFEWKVKGVVSHKSNLHMLVEDGDIELTRLLLSRLDETKLKKSYMKRMVLTELEFQRPRHLSCIHLAAMKGNTHMIELFRRCGMDVNFLNNKRDTPVLWAVRYNHIDAVRFLIAQDADLSMGNDKGSTPLYWAVRYGFSSLVELIVKEGNVDVNQKRKLGFYYPIILASALGYFEIVRILHKNGANPFMLVNNNLTALHVASAEGHHEIVQYLVDEAGLDVNQADINGNTALLFAAYGAKVRTMKVLVEKGADINTKNKVGQSVWEFSLNHPNENFLTCTLMLYKQFMRSTSLSELITFPRGKSPLHIAASTGNVKKLKELLDQGVDPQVRDINGNTFFHLAAKENKTEVLEEFISTFSISELNNNDDTALHVAAKNGNLEATIILMRKFKLDAKNKQGMTPLHVTVISDRANHKLVRKLVEHIVKTSSWSLVDAVDKYGNTPLHLACKKSYPEIIPELTSLNPKIKNRDGDNPFHIAAVNPNTAIFEAMMDTFNKPENGVDFNETNEFGEGCLHICARKSDSISLITLVSNGADLTLRNSKGNTVIHVLIEESVEEKHKTQAMIEEYRNIRNLSPLWWSMHHNQQLPNEGSDMYYEMMRRSMLHLTTELCNNEGHDSIQYAIRMKATEFFEEILNTPKVYKLYKHSKHLYDVTNVMPGVSRKNRKNSVKDIEENTGGMSKKKSYLNSIVSIDDEITAAKMLDIMPINEIVTNYWTNYQWIYVVLLCIHVVYMIFFTVFVSPSHLIYTNTVFANISEQYRTRILSTEYRRENSSKFGWFLLWPVLILLFELYYLAARFYYYLTSSYNYKKDPIKDHIETSSIILFNVVSTLLNIGVTNLGNVFTLGFCVTTFTWYAMLNMTVSFNNYLIVVSLVFLFGWSYLINFTKAIEGLHVFTIMLKYIILHDITRFLCLYIIFLLGCGMAFNTLFQIHPDIVHHSPSLSNTLYNAINAMLGLEPLFPEDFDRMYTLYGGEPFFIKTIYILYILAGTVILMNLLIAMLTDTYTTVQARQVSNWKVGTLKLALKMEEVLPIIQKIFKALCMNRNNLRYDFEYERWMMPIPLERIRRKDQTEAEGLSKVARRIENKIESLHTLIEELSNQTEVLAREFHRLNSEEPCRNRSAIKRFRNIGQMIAMSKANNT